MNDTSVSPRSHISTLVLSMGIFIGLCGLHRFYAGKIWTGILWLITGGILGIGQVIDIILIICGRFRDKQGRLIVR